MNLKDVVNICFLILSIFIGYILCTGGPHISKIIINYVSLERMLDGIKTQ